MKSEWKEYKLGDIASMKYGKMLPNKNVAGKYPVFSGYRVVGWTNAYNCKRDTPIVVARGVGGTGDVKILKTDCFLTNLAIMVDIDRSVCYPYYFYYKYLLNNLKWLDTGSAQSQITIDDLRRLSIKLPPLPVQRKIASILSALDDKIETNNAICRNLEELLLAVYRNVKYVNECVVKELHDLAEFSKNKKQISELNCQSYFSTENMLPGKAGAVAAESLPTMPKATACNPGDILVSNIRPYFKKIVYCSTNCGCSSDVLCFHPKEDIYSTWLFCSLYEDDFFDYVAAGSKGTKMPRGDKAHIMRYGIDVPPRKKLEEFKSMGNLVLTQINNLCSENKHLSQLRDSILPKLMNGELDVDNVKLK